MEKNFEDSQPDHYADGHGQLKINGDFKGVKFSNKTAS